MFYKIKLQHFYTGGNSTDFFEAKMENLECVGWLKVILILYLTQIQEGLTVSLKQLLIQQNAQRKTKKKNFFEKFRDYISRDPSWNFPVI